MRRVKRCRLTDLTVLVCGAWNARSADVCALYGRCWKSVRHDVGCVEKEAGFFTNFFLEMRRRRGMSSD